MRTPTSPTGHRSISSRPARPSSRCRRSHFCAVEQTRAEVDRRRPQLEAYQKLCADLGADPADEAIAWLLANPVVTSPIIGPRSVRLDGALRALEVSMPSDVLAKLDEIFRARGARLPKRGRGEPLDMRSATLGTSGPEISRVGIGTWQASGSGPWGSGPRSDDHAAIAAIRRAVERGVTWIDTAASYGLGHSEDVVRRALEPWQIGSEVLVFTKCGHPWDPPDRIRTDLAPDSIRRECEGSLRRLGVERIDLYQFHHADPTTPVEESWSTMAELVAEGKVRWAGVSNFDVELLERCEAIVHVDSVQPELNLLRREALREVIPWCRVHGTGVIAYSPLATGVLSGSYDRDRLLELRDDDWRRAHAEGILELVRRCGLIAGRLAVDATALLVAWTLSRDGVTSAICGARSQAHVDGWVGAADLDVPSEALAEIESIVDELGPV